MWLLFTLLVLAGVVSGNNEYGWKVGNEYTYHVESRTLTGINEFPTQYAGIFIKGLLTVQVKESGRLTAKLWKAQFSHLQANLTRPWDAQLIDLLFAYRDLPVSEKPFDVKLDDGLIDSVIVEQDVPDWEVVLLKSIVSQLQVDTTGKKLVEGQETKIPSVDDPRGWFTSLEDYFAGVCEVRYDFKPLSKQHMQTEPELVPKPELKGDGQHIDVIKIRKYDRYPEMSEKVFGMTRLLKKGPKNNKKLMSKSSTGRMIVSGTLKNFVIQSSVSISETTITPDFDEKQNSTLKSKLSLTLDNVIQITNPMPSPTNPKFTGYRISFETTPTPLESAPKHPVWPKIIDYEGKFIDENTEVDGLTAVKKLVFQIAEELEDPNMFARKGTLDKFTVLVNIIRTMSRDQIAEAESSMDISPKKVNWDDNTEAVKQNAWSVFRDAITQSGTGPALLTIKKWIENGETRSMEAADILSRIPATVRHVTDKYTEAFFELATNPRVTETPFLNITALTAFSELVYQSQLHDKSIYKFYPAHTTGRATEEQLSNIINKYIPYLAVQLKKAVDDGDSARIQTYIVALGNIGMHEAIPALEPYLTGREKLTAFQKTLMLASLSNFAANHPKKAMSGLAHIYMNTTESYEVRCMALYMLPMTNPPLGLLREVVETANEDENKQVKSAVKSTLQNLADLRDPEWESLAENAREAMKSLKNENYDFMNSREFIFNKMKDGESLVSNALINYIGSDDGPIPRTVYLAAILYHGNFKGTAVEFMAMIPKLDSLLDALVPADKKPLVKMATEKIAEELNIVGDTPVEMEGNFMWRTKFMSHFLPYDENTIRNLLDKIAECKSAKKDKTYGNVNQLNMNEMIIGDTTDTGLPFVYSLRESVLHKFNSMDNFKSGQINSEFKFAIGHKVQRNVGFLTPFDHRHFVAGVDKYTLFHVPLKVSLEISVPKKSMQLSIWPLKGNKRNWLVHRMVKPFNSIQNVMNLQPMMLQSDTQVLHVDDPGAFRVPVPNTILHMDVEADKSNKDIWTSDAERTWCMFPWSNTQNMYHSLAVTADEKPEESDPIILTASYGTLDVEAGTEDANEWTQFVSVSETFNENMNSEQRKTRYLTDAAKGIQLAQAYVVDLHIQIPDGRDSWRQNLTLAWSMSNAESKGRLLFQLRLEQPLGSVRFEVCAASQMAITPSYFAIYDEVSNSTPRFEFDVDVRYGKGCLEKNRVNIMGAATRSKELKEEIDKTAIVKECKKQMEQGNKLLRACQKSGARALQVDEVELYLKAGSEEINTAAEQGLSSFANGEYVNANVVVSPPQNNNRDQISLKAKVSRDMRSGNITVHSPNLNFAMNDVDLDVLQDSSEEREDVNADDGMWAMAGDIATCVMDLNRAETFDGKEFPLKLSSCWQVLMTTYPKSNPKKPSEKLAMLEDNSVSILAREINGQKEIKVILGQNEILLVPGGQLPEVMVNGQKVEISRAVSHQGRQDDEVVFEIFQRGNSYVSVVSDSFDIDVTYDGKRVIIEEPDMYGNSLRGLCGNYDGDLKNDFMSPGNCLLKHPEEFIASYTLTKDQCEGENLKNVKSLQKSACTPIPRH